MKNKVSRTASVEKLRLRIKRLLVFFIIALVLSGLTALPIESQLSLANEYLQPSQGNALKEWIQFTYEGVSQTNVQFPFMGYGTDWLAFAHVVIAVAFLGPLRNPAKISCVIEFGM